MPAFDQIESIFHDVRVLDPAERGAFLDRVCGDDLELRREVESLLTHAESDTSRIDLRRGGETRLVDRGPVTEGPGTRIGPYKILQQIGEGGFGVVYMAEQERPVRRKVALKIIKLGMDTKQVIARFEVERQALALMDHPNIARVLDAGATETGRPYFVMELVKGIPITEYCDSRNLPTLQRLELFIDVCHAVQHAHHKGIIHRDLKPSNVLVTLHDDRPVPKVIDFGIAKATSHRLTERTLFTEFRQLIGTPEYMSPDQAEISGLDIDTRSDIYSLGVLLYELLTGTTPFDAQTLRTVGYAEVQRIIREVEPPIPSTRVGTMERQAGRRPTPASDGDGRGLAEIARHRRTDPDGLRRSLRGDLDWIIMKAMEKDRTRRYDTANELAADVRRHLSSQPVMAGPPGMLYKARKFVRRHRVGVGAGTLATVALLIGLSLAALGFVRASRQAAHTRAVNAYLQSLIMDVEAAGDAGPSLDETIRRGRELFGDDHAVVGTLLTTRAASLNTSGRLDEAIAAQREALAFHRRAHQGDHPSIAAAAAELGGLLEDRSDLAEAEAAYREALAMQERLYGPESKVTVDTMESLTSLLVETANPTRTAEIRDLWEQTVTGYEAALGPDHRVTVKQACHLAVWLGQNGFEDASAAMLEDVLPRARRVLPDDLLLFLALQSKAQQMIFRKQNMAGAIPVIEELAEVGARIWGPDHFVSLVLTLELITLYKQADDVEGARLTVDEYLEKRQRSEAQPSLVWTMQHLQAWRATRDWLAETPERGRRFLEYLVQDFSAAAPASEECLELLEAAGEWMSEQGFDEQAADYFLRLVKLLREREDAEAGALATALIHAGDAHVRLGRPSEAEAMLRECRELRLRELPEDSWLIASANASLGHCLAAQGGYEEAETLLLEAVAQLESSAEAPRERVAKTRGFIAALYEAWGRPEDAARWQ